MQLRLQEHLKRLGKTQVWLAEQVGVSTGYMSLLNSGKRAPSPRTLRRMAEALEVGVAGLLESDAGTIGFAEASVTPLDLSDSNTSSSLAQLVAPDIRTPEYYRINRDMMALGLLAGDVLIVDKSAEAKNSDLVVMHFVDPETEQSELELRRVALPWLISDITGSQPLVAVDDPDQTRAIHGVVKGSARGPGLHALTGDAA